MEKASGKDPDTGGQRFDPTSAIGARTQLSARRAEVILTGFGAGNDCGLGAGVCERRPREQTGTSQARPGHWEGTQRNRPSKRQTSAIYGHTAQESCGPNCRRPGAGRSVWKSGEERHAEPENSLERRAEPLRLDSTVKWGRRGLCFVSRSRCVREGQCGPERKW